MYETLEEALSAWREQGAAFTMAGATYPSVRAFVPESFKRDYGLAMDSLAQLGMDNLPALQTDPNSAVPALLTTLIDPAVFKILFAPNKAAVIFDEVRKGTWLDETAMFPSVEHTGEVSSYGDYNENGRAGVNTNWPQRQAYLFQVIKEYGERELERAGLARINWVSEIDQAAATIQNKYANYTYFFGVLGLQNFGLTNDPNLSATLTPALKGWGGTKWINNGVVVATANEIFTDFQSMFFQLQVQLDGLIDREDKLTIAMSPQVDVAMTTTNTFNVNVYDLMKKNFPNVRFETAVQYGATSATNTQGIAAGNMVQMMAEEVEGQDVGYCAFNEKARAHPIIRKESSFRQKMSAGTWGAVIRIPAALVQMVGV